MGDDRRSRAGIAVAAGLLAGLSLPPLGWPWLLWPALAVLWALAGSPPPAGGRGAGGGAGCGAVGGAVGLLWGLVAVLVSHRWLLWLHPLDWIGVPGPLSLPLCLLLWLLCGLAGGLLVAAWLVVVARLGAERLTTALLGATLWGLVEVLLARGPLFWIGVGSAALPGDRLLAGVAALVGAGGLAALQLLIGWTLWRMVAEPAALRRWLPAVVVLIGAGHLVGALALAAVNPASGPAVDPAAEAGERRIERLMVLQPAIPTRHKFEARQQQRLLSQLAAAQARTDPAGGERGVASLILPEGALALGQPLPRPAGVEVLSGGFRREGEELRSSLLQFPTGSRDPAAWVDKHRVVPLGEWVPLAGWLRWSGLSAVGGIEPGEASRLLPRPTGAIGVAICYEISDGAALAAATRDGARWLLASANLDPYPLLLQRQYMALAQLRAIETGRWLVSAANTGPSLVVDSAGRAAPPLVAGRSGTAVLSVRQRSALTPYVRWGEVPLLVLVLVAAAARRGRYNPLRRSRP